MIAHLPDGNGNVLHLPLQPESLLMHLAQQFPAVFDGQQTLNINEWKAIPFQPSDEQHGTDLGILVITVSIGLICFLWLQKADFIIVMQCLYTHTAHL